MHNTYSVVISDKDIFTFIQYANASCNVSFAEFTMLFKC